MSMSDKSPVSLAAKALQIRRTVLQMCAKSGGHLASSFSCVDILVSLYYGGPLSPAPVGHSWTDRDRFILSKGHGEGGIYAILADQGYFPSSWLDESYRRGACLLGGHPDHQIPGIEITSGSLGHGLGIAAGMALAAKQDARAQSIYTLLGDAECTEGSVWESAMFAAQRELDNLVAIVDRNGIGSLDYTTNYTSLEPFADKWRAFGWRVLEVDGHDHAAILEAVETAQRDRAGAPTVLIASTVKGKGISFVEDDPIWHVRGISAEEAVRADAELCASAQGATL
jgi:transketolase